MHDVTVMIGGLLPEHDMPALKKAASLKFFFPATTQAIESSSASDVSNGRRRANLAVSSRISRAEQQDGFCFSL